MPKFLIRIVALLLVPCLVFDPATVSALSVPSPHTTYHVPLSCQSRFQEEALAAAAVPFRSIKLFLIQHRPYWNRPSRQAEIPSESEQAPSLVTPEGQLPFYRLSLSSRVEPLHGAPSTLSQIRSAHLHGSYKLSLEQHPAAPETITPPAASPIQLIFPFPSNPLPAPSPNQLAFPFLQGQAGTVVERPPAPTVPSPAASVKRWVVPANKQSLLTGLEVFKSFHILTPHPEPVTTYNGSRIVTKTLDPRGIFDLRGALIDKNTIAGLYLDQYLKKNRGIIVAALHPEVSSLQAESLVLRNQSINGGPNLIQSSFNGIADIFDARPHTLTQTEEAIHRIAVISYPLPEDKHAVEVLISRLNYEARNRHKTYRCLFVPRIKVAYLVATTDGFALQSDPYSKTPGDILAMTWEEVDKFVGHRHDVNARILSSGDFERFKIGQEPPPPAPLVSGKPSKGSPADGLLTIYEHLKDRDFTFREFLAQRPFRRTTLRKEFWVLEQVGLLKVNRDQGTYRYSLDDKVRALLPSQLRVLTRIPALNKYEIPFNEIESCKTEIAQLFRSFAGESVSSPPPAAEPGPSSSEPVRKPQDYQTLIRSSLFSLIDDLLSTRDWENLARALTRIDEKEAALKAIAAWVAARYSGSKRYYPQLENLLWGRIWELFSNLNAHDDVMRAFPSPNRHPPASDREVWNAVRDADPQHRIPVWPDDISQVVEELRVYWNQSRYVQADSSLKVEPAAPDPQRQMRGFALVPLTVLKINAAFLSTWMPWVRQVSETYPHATQAFVVGVSIAILTWMTQKPKASLPRRLDPKLLYAA